MESDRRAQTHDTPGAHSPVKVKLAPGLASDWTQSIVIISYGEDRLDMLEGICRDDSRDWTDIAFAFCNIEIPPLEHNS